MKSVKPTLIFLCILIIVGFILIYKNDRETNQQSMRICDQEYALCTSAKCIPDPSHSKQAICFCEVMKGKSMGTTHCKKLEPKIDANGVQTVYSTFSLEQLSEGKKVMQCPNGTPWTWCLNKKCTVDPMDPNKAVCICDIMYQEDWVTFGGNCDQVTCQTGYWSGAPIDAFHEGANLLIKEFDLDPSIIKECVGNPQ
jgi:hypothetical protein